MKLFHFFGLIISILYGSVVHIRNLLFDIGFFNQKKFESKIIGVGNISTGGTGKTVLIDYFSKYLKDKYEISVISRGYKRKSKGLIEVDRFSDYQKVGDEPYMLFMKNPHTKIVVSENRVKAIEFLENKYSYQKIFLLDDVFQHRWIKPGLSILLTKYNSPFFSDFVLPLGKLREFRSGYKRSDIILVTKCPNKIDDFEKKVFIEKIKLNKNQKIFFSTIGYNKLIFNRKESRSLNDLKNYDFILLTGIADNNELLIYLTNFNFKLIEFPDHHDFTNSDIKKIKDSANGKIILTTEKDYVRIVDKINYDLLYYLPIEMKFVGNEGTIFNKEIEGYLKED
tara:strand:+ start:31347 stop:32363 length:1017 start_codon:yes stop_codon:yes gene_type:complete